MVCLGCRPGLKNEVANNCLARNSDERQPSCRKCGISNRVCVYEPLKTWVFLSSAEKGSTACDSLSGPETPFSSDNGSEGESRGWSFFREQTTPVLGDFSKFTLQFFTDHIPRLSAAERSVRSMAIALASRQELMICPPDRLYDLTMIRSNAISASLQELTRPDCSILAILQCGLFFVGYECLQDPMQINPETSARHLGAGLRILEEHRSRPKSGKGVVDSVSDIIDQYIEPMYLQMEMMLSMFNDPMHTICDLSKYHTEAKRPKLPPRFTSLIDARDSFFQIYRWHYLYRAQDQKLWTPSSSAFRTVREVFVDWHTLVIAYGDTLRNGAEDDATRKRLMIMLSRWSLLMVGLVHSTVITSHGKSDGRAGSPYFPNGGRLKISVVDLTKPDLVTITFIVDAHSLGLLEICDWTETGLNEDPTLRIWPVVQIRRLQDGSGRGVVKFRMGFDDLEERDLRAFSFCQGFEGSLLY